jgi:hypothetical protein
VLPAINYALVKVLCLPPKRKDFLVARASATLLMVGNLFIGLATSSAVFILGEWPHPSLPTEAPFVLLLWHGWTRVMDVAKHGYVG